MKTRDLTIASLLIAMGIILPMFTHYIAAGNILLPMHIPVLIAGLVLKPKHAVLVGAITPILSSVLTQMPPAFPMLPIMVFELATYALIASILKSKFNLNIYLILIISLICGRVIAALVAQVLIIGFDAPFASGVAFITAAITTGYIGVIIQLVISPPIAKVINKRYN